MTKDPEETGAEFSGLYEKTAAAAVRGYALRTGMRLPERLTGCPLEELDPEDITALLEAGKEAGIKLYRFKRGHETLPRVRFAMGFLQAVCPESLCDIGSGRGVFLFPFLDRFPSVPVTALDLLDHRISLLNDIRTGGIPALTALRADICSRPLPEKSADVVTALEVLEHIPDVQEAVRAAVSIARRYVVVTVPSKPDSNPEHIHLLTRDLLKEYFGNAGCTRLQFGSVLDHLTLIASVPS